MAEGNQNDDKVEYKTEEDKNLEKYGYYLTDEELREYIDNEYFEEIDNLERYGDPTINEVDEDLVFEDKRGKYIVRASPDFEMPSKHYLKEGFEKSSPLKLEEILKRTIIKDINSLNVKMKLLEPNIYNNITRFYLEAKKLL